MSWARAKDKLLGLAQGVLVQTREPKSHASQELVILYWCKLDMLASEEIILANRAWRLALATFSVGVASFVIASLWQPLPSSLGTILFIVSCVLLLINTVALVYGKAALLGSDIAAEARSPARRAVVVSCVGYPSILVLMSAISMFALGGES